MELSSGQQSGEPSQRQPPARTWVVDPPPFGVASERFTPEGRRHSPDYHVAYRDVTQPPRWTAKGWVGIDDYIKPRRGTAPSVYGTSSLVPPCDPPRHSPGLSSLSAACPNEVRLQELINLQRRRVTAEPGPGAYEPRDVKQHRRFRRLHDPQLDGPFFLDQLPGGATTRSKEIAAVIRTAGDSGLGPGEYEGPLCKDLTMRNAPKYKVGTTSRDGRSAQTKSLSISRSIQNGIDWHVPVIVLPLSSVANTDRRSSGDSMSPSPSPHGHSSSPMGTSERPVGSHGGGGGSRSTSPSAIAEQLVGAPPAPPSSVSRSVRRQQQRRPGDWDWNRLGQNYRTTWTTLHGGAYSHGEHTPPRSSPAALGRDSPSASFHTAQPPPLVQGIYPIQEESSGALEQDASGALVPRGPGRHAHWNPAQQSAPHRATNMVQPPAVYHPPAPHSAPQPYYVASFGRPEAAGVTGGAGGVGGGAGVAQPVGGGGESGGSSARSTPFITEEDLRRRREAAELAGRAQQASSRISDWHSKFAG